MSLRGYIGIIALGMLIGAGSFFALLPAFASAQTAAPVCTTDAQKAACQSQYNELEQEIAQYQQVIDQTKAKESSLQGDVTTLNAQIAQAQAEINQRSITIGQLNTQIAQKQQTVQTLQQQLSASEDSVAKILREKDETDDTSLTVLVFSSGSLSDFFSSVTDLDSVDAALQQHMQELQGIKTQTQQQQDALSQQQDQQLDAKHDALVLQQTVNSAKTQKTAELTVTKGQESAYNAVLADKQAQATALKNAIFQLRDTSNITFETALTYAQEASKATGVRAAFILAILRQESDLGQNVGQCLLTSATTGAGKGKNTGTPFKNVMNPTRDVPPFLAITTALGIDPYSQVVSCPQSVGYGGAMGPSQFIASTWKLYAARVAAATGDPVADPWNAKDAVMATALYMKDLGAAAQTYSAERKAAAEYYAGGSWATLGLSYASSVLSFADQYQTNIDCINDNTTCSVQ